MKKNNTAKVTIAGIVVAAIAMLQQPLHSQIFQSHCNRMPSYDDNLLRCPDCLRRAAFVDLARTTRANIFCFYTGVGVHGCKDSNPNIYVNPAYVDRWSGTCNNVGDNPACINITVVEQIEVPNAVVKVFSSCSPPPA